MIKLRKILNPLTRLRKVWDSRQNALRLEKIRIEDFLEKSPRYDGVVVSLTSIPSRLGILHLAIRSLFCQTCLPHKIVLWLHHDLKGQIPQSLSSLENEVFEIRYNDLTCPHRKLIHSLACFPDHCIVTCDDDCMYDNDWLEKLYASHVMHPDEVIGGKCRRIVYGGDGQAQPYKNWKYEKRGGFSEDCLMPVGFAGTLYPPRCMMNDVSDSGLFLKLVPYNDDLWFKAMSLLNGVKVRTTLVPSREPVQINRSQKVALRRYNIREDGNNRQWADICSHYHIEPWRLTGTKPAGDA